MAEHNNQNDVPVLATVIDNAGYEDQVEKKIHIDNKLYRKLRWNMIKMIL